MWTFIICVTSTASQRNISPKNDHLPSFTEPYIFPNYIIFYFETYKKVLLDRISKLQFSVQKNYMIICKKSGKISVLQPLLLSEIYPNLIFD